MLLPLLKALNHDSFLELLFFLKVERLLREYFFRLTLFNLVDPCSLVVLALDLVFEILPLLGLVLLQESHELPVPGFLLLLLANELEPALLLLLLLLLLSDLSLFI